MTAYASYLTDPTSVMGRRIGAYLIDVILLAVIVIAVAVPAFNSVAVTAPSGTIDCGTDSSRSTTLSDTSAGRANGVKLCFDDGTTVHYVPENKVGGFLATVYGLAALLSLLDLVVLQGLTGASLGKMAVGLRVVDDTGKPAGYGRIVVRWLLLIVDSFCCALPGLISSFTSKGHRRIGDMAGGTYVVGKDDVGRPPVSSYGSPNYEGAPGFGSGGYSETPGYGQPGPTGWAPPPVAPGSGWGSPPPGPPSTGFGQPPTAPSSPAPSADGPTWDAARDTYIQYDRDRGEWVEWNDATKAWGPISQ